MPKVTIDGIEIEVEPGTSIIQAAEQLGIEIPRFCYHDKLSVPANCRMCLVEVEKAPKPVPSCAMPCMDDMVVKTDSEMVHKARKGVMEFLLVNHPLDCPICDQGGECDLQDQAMAYGYDRSRYEEEKRAVKDKELGPLVKTVMTRCIHCTRCVRFGEEVAGVEEMGLLNRGEEAEIGTYVEQAMTSELSGNMIDVCPVGALTNKPYAFVARPWELRKIQGVDVTDAVGSNISVQVRGGSVMRIIPRLNEDVNECWISDKTRFVVDGLKNQRLDTPYVRKKGKLQATDWEGAFKHIQKNIKGKKVAGIIGDLVDCESMIALKDFVTEVECRQDGVQLDVNKPVGYRFNTTIARIEEADAILLVGTNPRTEAAILNARIYKNWFENRVKIGVIGKQIKLNYPYKYLGAGPETLGELAEGKGEFAEILSKAKKPMVILGAGALCRDDGEAIQALTRQLAEKYDMVGDGWNGYNMLHTAASRVGALELGCVSDKPMADLLSMDVVYLLGADEVDPRAIGENSFVIYQGHHGDKMAQHADVILPGAAYTEKSATYVNTEGRPQQAVQAIFPPGDAREDWQILRALDEYTGRKKVKFSTLAEARERLAEENAIFKKIGEVKPARWSKFAKEGKMHNTPFSLSIQNFYQTDAISRASETMKKCTEQLLPKGEEGKAVANG